MTRAPKATWARLAKDRPVPLTRTTGAVNAECSAATYDEAAQDRPVAGVLEIIVFSMSSTSWALLACRRLPARRKVEVLAKPCK